MAAALAPVQNHVLNVCYECCHQLLQAVVILGHFYYQKVIPYSIIGRKHRNWPVAG